MLVSSFNGSGNIGHFLVLCTFTSYPSTFQPSMHLEFSPVKCEVRRGFANVELRLHFHQLPTLNPEDAEIYNFPLTISTKTSVNLDVNNVRCSVQGLQLPILLPGTDVANFD